MKLQLNILIEPNRNIDYLFSDLPRLFYPVLWFESDARLPASMSGQLGMLVNLPFIMQACGLISILLGLLGMVAAVICHLRQTGAAALADKKPSLAACEYAAVAVKELTVVGSEESSILKTPLRSSK